MNTQTTVNRTFDWIAPVYDGLAFVVFGRQLQRAQAVFLDQIPADASVLLLGGGTGWLLEQVLTRCRPKRVVYLDASAQMVARASRRMVQRAIMGSVEFRVGNETKLKPGERFDLILTPFVLDLFTEQTLRSQLIPHLLSVLKPGGLWLVTDFVQTQVWWQRALLWMMICFFRLTAGIEARHLSDWQGLLTESGLICQERRRQVGGMVSAEVWMRPA